jgi:methylated-DNA-protein-cysteine methyltransferase-like protein
MDDVVVERVLLAAEQVPPGRVASYGDLAELVAVGPRIVGRILSVHGGRVPWWRITSASGDLPAHLRDQARPRWAHEGITWKDNGLGCRIRDFRADADRLAGDYAQACARAGLDGR